jgi:hypothetical protein
VATRCQAQSNSTGTATTASAGAASPATTAQQVDSAKTGVVSATVRPVAMNAARHSFRYAVSDVIKNRHK